MPQPLSTLRNPDRPASPYARDLTAASVMERLQTGWQDLRQAPWMSLAKGAFLTLISRAALWAGHSLSVGSRVPRHIRVPDCLLACGDRTQQEKSTSLRSRAAEVTMQMMPHHALIH